MSHPSWVCGLKPIGQYKSIERWGVTPFVGVWIETANDKLSEYYDIVTPFVGVWIETLGTYKRAKRKRGHTLRGCVD